VSPGSSVDLSWVDSAAEPTDLVMGSWSAAFTGADWSQIWLFAAIWL